MENFLPSATIVLGVLAAVLLLLSVYLIHRNRRLRQRHQAELDTLMGIAGQAHALGGSSGSIEECRDEHGEPAGKELAAILAAMEQIDARLDRFSREQDRLADQLRTLVGEGNDEVHTSRQDLDRIHQAIDDLRKQVEPLSGGETRPEPARMALTLAAPPPNQDPPPDRAAHKSEVLFRASTAGIDVEEISPGDFDIEASRGQGITSERMSHFGEDRVFFQSSLEGGRPRGWYFTGPGNEPHGPYDNRETATAEMKTLDEPRADAGFPAA